MQFSFYKTADDAEGQLNTGISAAALSIPLKTGQGAQFPQPINGAATSLGTGTTLNDTGIGASGIAVGDFIENTTDGSHAWVTAVNTNDISTTQLIGGSDNTWQNADAWYAKRFLVTLNQRDANGAITASEKVRISGRATDTLTVLTGDRGFDGSVAQSFLADDYVSLFSVSKHIESLQTAVSELSQLVQNLSDQKLAITTDTTQRNADKRKQPVRAATTANITISTALNNGDTLDGVTLATGDRVLVKDQSSGAENGIYIVGASPTRATDFDGNDEVAGADIWVQEGTVNADTLWICTNNGTPTVGSTALTFVETGNSRKVATGTSEVNLNTSVAETTLYTTTVPGKILGTSNALRLHLWVTDISFDAATTLTIRVKYGSATLSFATNALTIATNDKGLIIATVIASGATGSQLINAQYTSLQQVQESIGGVTTGAIDSTADQTFSVTAQFSVSNAQNLIKTQGAILEIIR